MGILFAGSFGKFNLIWSFLHKQVKRAEGTPLIGLHVSPVRESEFPIGLS